jgi:hypothetical protein
MSSIVALKNTKTDWAQGQRMTLEVGDSVLAELKLCHTMRGYPIILPCLHFAPTRVCRCRLDGDSLPVVAVAAYNRSYAVAFVLV